MPVGIYPRTLEHNRNLSRALKGLKKPSLIGNQHSKGKHNSLKTEFKKGQNTGKNNVNWKGKNVRYEAIHSWIYRNFKRPDKCENCNTEKINSYYGHWHNVNGKYRRIRKDWKLLCAKCHRKTYKGVNMRKIIILKGCKNYKEGDVVVVNANEAHSLIDKGYAKLYKMPEMRYEDKMMRPMRRFRRS